MKTNAVIALLPLLANGAAVLQPRQGLGGGLSSLLGSVGGSLMSGVMPKRKAAKIIELKPRNPQAKRVKMVWGPFKLRGANSTSKLGNSVSLDPGGTGYNYQFDSDFPTDVMLLDGIVAVEDDKNNKLTLDNGIFSHHFLALDLAKPQKPSFTCDNGVRVKYVPVPGSVIVGGAAEDAEAHYQTTIKSMPGVTTGYYVKKDSPIFATTDVVNYNKDDRDVYYTADIEYLPGKPAGYLDASPVMIPVEACNPRGMMAGFVIPPKDQNKFSVNSTGIIAAEDTVMFLFRGHVHDGGANVMVKVNEKPVCDSKALYGGPGHVGKTNDGKSWESIRDMVTCQEGILVKKGDKIAIDANFDLTAHPAREHGHGGGGGMLGGMLGGLLGGGSGMAEQMAVSIIYVAPVNSLSK